MTDKVETIKALIQERDGIAGWAQRLLFKGQQLEDGFTFNDYAVQPGDQIHLVIRLSGGGNDDKNEAPPRPTVVPAVIRVRENYNPLAFLGNLESDETGAIKASFKLPDNLTRYRVMAIAHTTKSFGAGQTKLTACLPLMVKPAPPRFLNFSDECKLSLVLYNQSDSPMKAKVAMRAYNCELIEDGYSVVIPANYQSEIGFPIKANKVGKSKFQAVAVGFMENSNDVGTDACNFDFPVYAPNTTETFAVTSFVDEKEVAIQQPFKRPDNILKEFGHLEVVTSSTILQEAADAFVYLYEYPHLCSEQVSSRLLSTLALKDVVKAFKNPSLPNETELKANIDQAINELECRQNNKGEFGFWNQSGKSYPYVNIYVAFALSQAKAAGFTVNPQVVTHSKTYLSAIETKLSAAHYDTESGFYKLMVCFAANVLSSLGSPDSALDLIENIWEDSVEVVATELLALAIPVFFNSSDERVDEAVKVLNSRLSVTPTRAYWDSSSSNTKTKSDYFYFDTVTTNALILSALIKADETNKVIPKLVQGLNHAKRSGSGRWYNTQDNTFALLAINQYFNTYEKVQEPKFKTGIVVDKTLVAEHSYNGFTTDSFSTKIPNKLLLSTTSSDAKEGKQEDANLPLFLIKEGIGRLYYRLAFQAALANPFAPALDRGFTVTRSYEAADDPKDMVTKKNGDETLIYVKAGTRVRVSVNVVNTNAKFYVALVDYLPGGLESLSASAKKNGWWSRDWWTHTNMRDSRTEVYADYLWAGIHNYSYLTRATALGSFMVPAAKAEEMYEPECFGRSNVVRMIVTETLPSQ